MKKLEMTPALKNEIVVYQPNETVRLEVRLEDETVWLTQSQMAEMFGCTVRNVRVTFGCPLFRSVSVFAK